MSPSSFVKNTLILSIATLLSKFLGSVFRIPLQNIAGDEVLGIFSLVYPVYMVALTLSVAGIPIAISKLIAEARTDNKMEVIKQIYRTAGILALLFGVLSFTLIWTFSVEIANALGGQDTRLALIIVAATLLVSPYMAVYRGFFQGFEDMKPTAISQVIEQFVRVGLILSIAYYLVQQGYTNQVVSGGVMIGSVIGALASLLYLRLKFTRTKKRYMQENSFTLAHFKKWSIRILKVSLPIAVGAITMPLLNFVDSFTIAYGLKSAGYPQNNISYLYGIYGRGLSLVQIATVFATSIVLPLIPFITTRLAQQDYTQTRRIVERTHEMTHLVSWPAAIGLFALTLPLNLSLFTNLEGSLMLSIISISSVFTSLTVLGTGILQGMNLAKHAALIIISGVLIKIFSNIILIQFFGLTGAALSTLFVYILLFAVNTIFIFKNLAFRIVRGQTIKIIFASVIMGVVVGVPTLFLSIDTWTRLQGLAYSSVAILVGGLIYIGLLFIMKAIDKELLLQLPIVGRYIKQRES